MTKQTDQDWWEARDPEVDRWIIDAMRCALAEDHDGAEEAVGKLAKSDPDLVSCALIVWIDVAIRTAGLDLGDVAFRLRPAWKVQGQVTTDGSTVDPSVEWAALLFTARVNQDYKTQRALLDSTTTDKEWTDQVYAVLGAAASTIRACGEGKQLIFRTDDLPT